MALFDDLTKKAAKMTEEAIDKTQELANTAKMKLKIKNLQSDQDDIYRKLGKRYYDILKNQDVIVDLELETMCKQIEDYDQKIMILKQEMQEESSNI